TPARSNPLSNVISGDQGIVIGGVVHAFDAAGGGLPSSHEHPVDRVAVVDRRLPWRRAERFDEAGATQALEHEGLERAVVVEVAGDDRAIAVLLRGGDDFRQLTRSKLVVSSALEVKVEEPDAGRRRLQRDAAAAPWLHRVQTPAKRRLL